RGIASASVEFRTFASPPMGAEGGVRRRLHEANVAGPHWLPLLRNIDKSSKAAEKQDDQDFQNCHRGRHFVAGRLRKRRRRSRFSCGWRRGQPLLCPAL